VIGDDDVARRRTIVTHCDGLGLRPSQPVVHEQATIGSDVELGPGSVLCARCRITTNVRAGRHLVMAPGATLSHDARVGEVVLLGQDAHVAGAVHIGDRVVLGDRVDVLPGRTIGSDVEVAPGAVVVDDLPDGSRAGGVPARVGTPDPRQTS
jgi:hypothetical protein